MLICCTSLQRARRRRCTLDAKTGRLASITGEDPLERTLQDQTYTWDIVGNLTARAQTLGETTLEETFAYDSLNRLTQSKVAGETAQNVSYDGLGNITAKTGVGGYVYGDTARPHRLAQAGSAHFAYDDNGNVIQEHETGQDANPTRSFAYTPFNKAASIKQGTHTTEFEYGPDRSRTRRVDTVNTGAGTSVTTTLYFGGAEKVIAPDGSYTWKRYVADGFLIEQTYNSHDTLTKEDTRHLLKDHLGSIALILDEAGLDKDLLPLQRLSYDAWGQRRAPDDWTILARLTLSSPTHGAVTPYGYTGHEMLDAVGIIHMNGRIYDPKLGRFLQADPVIQFPNAAQNHNRYSYVLNNPLAYVDPSGYFIGKLFNKVFRGLNKLLGDFAPFLSIALLAIFPAMHLWVMESWMRAFAFGFVTGGIASGSFKGALFGGISAAAFYGIGQKFTPEATGFFKQGGLGHVLAHGVTGGIMAEIQGGQFGHGFLAAGLTKAVMGRFDYADLSASAVTGRVAIAAIVGGTISRITGGKFANGALTAGMAQLLNNETAAIAAGNSSEPSTPIGDSRPLTEGEVKMAKEVFGDALDPNKTRVHRKRWWLFQRRGMAMAPNGDIYFHPNDFVDDFSQLGIGSRTWFVHELTHVWQHQQGVNVTLRGMMNRNYNYSPLNVSRSFSSYGIEAQASIVADYYRVKSGYSPIQGNASLKDFQSVLPFGN